MIIITGATGYVGSHITRCLVSQGRPARALVYNPERARNEGRLNGVPVELVQGDVTQPETLEKAFQGAEAVIHTVAIAIEKGGRTYEAINYGGTVNTVNAARKTGIRRLINLSQLGADSQLPYRFLASKGKAQEYIASSGMDWTAFRPSVIWGPEDEFANTFAKLVPFSPVIYPIVAGPEAKFEPVWVEDVAVSVAKALDDPTTIGKEIELGGPEILTLEEIERRTLEAMGVKRTMVRFPLPLLKFVVALMEVALPNPPVTRSLLELLAVSNVTQNNEINRFVPEPRPFTAANIAPYMRNFRVKQTLAQFMGK